MRLLISLMMLYVSRHLGGAGWGTFNDWAIGLIFRGDFSDERLFTATGRPVSVPDRAVAAPRFERDAVGSGALASSIIASISASPSASLCDLVLFA